MGVDLWSFSQYGLTNHIPGEEIKTAIVGGMIGALILCRVVHYTMSKLSAKKTLFITIIGGITGYAFVLFGNPLSGISQTPYLPFIIWQTSVALSLLLSINWGIENKITA